MSNYAEEAADLSKLGGALVVNMGTVTPDGLANYVKAIQAYNSAGRPIIFDPVGYAHPFPLSISHYIPSNIKTRAGATAVRRNAVRTILSAGHLSVIKGNEGEIKTVFGVDYNTQQRGVDSSSTLTPLQKASLVRRLAAREKNIAVMTGTIDYISDGERVFEIANGHAYLGSVTGTGCALGTTISAAVAVWPEEEDRLLAVVSAVVHYEIAAEQAAVRSEVRGPGTFVPAFLDELYGIREATAGGKQEWFGKVRVARVYPEEE